MIQAVLDRLREDLAFADYFGFVHGGETLVTPSFFEALAAIQHEKAGARQPPAPDHQSHRQITLPEPFAWGQPE